MRKIHILIFLLIIAFLPLKAQELNSYKYVIVPTEYSFMDGPDKYELNSLTNFLFEKYGFESYMADEDLPAKYQNDPCSGLYADVKNNSGMFRTKLEVILKDCKGKVKFVSEEGKSRKKEFKAAFHDALRDAFVSIADLNYRYDEAIAAKTDAEVGIKKSDPVYEEAKPASKKEAMKQEMPESKIQVVKQTADKSNRIFLRDDMAFYLEKTEKGFRFFQKGMAEPFAMLVSSRIPDQYIYSSISGQGIAFFDENGNLIVEILNSADNSTESKTYMLRDQ